MLQACEELGLDMRKCFGQGYDGAAAMIGPDVYKEYMSGYWICIRKEDMFLGKPQAKSCASMHISPDLFDLFYFGDHRGQNPGYGDPAPYILLQTLYVLLSG